MANYNLQAQINNPQWDVMVTGRYFCDLILTGLPEMPHLGDEVWGKHCELVPGASFIPAVVTLATICSVILYEIRHVAKA
jgi:hypothetical protein